MRREADMAAGSDAGERAVFLDRDGVLVTDEGGLYRVEDVRLAPGAAQALSALRSAGFRLVVVSNQTVVSRGLLSEAAMIELEASIEARLVAEGGPPLDGFYFCPHHPNATLPRYRGACTCRKPAPGMLLRAGRERGIALPRSYLVGDRVTDVIAGARAGCRTVLVTTGQHAAPPIETSEPVDPSVTPDHVCDDLAAASRWILAEEAKRA